MNGIVEGLAVNTIWATVASIFRLLTGQQIRISSPVFGETLSAPEFHGETVRYRVHGTLKCLPKGKQIWLVTEDESSGKVWPQGFEAVIHSPTSGEWSGRISVFPTVGRLKITAVLAPATSQDFFRYYQSVGILRNYAFEALQRIPPNCTNRYSVPVVIP